MTLATFFDWWRDQLAEILPTSLRDALNRRHAEVSIAIDGDHVTFSGTGATGVSVNLAPDNAIETTSAMDAFLADMSGRPRRVRLTLAPGEFLVTQLTLPTAARPHLAETVRYQLPQITPFDADRCWFACGENHEASTQDTLTAWLLVVPRQKLSRILDIVGLSAPRSPWPCENTPSPEHPFELTWRGADEHAPSHKHLRMALATMAMLWLGALAMHVSHKLEVRDHLEQTANALRVQALEVERYRGQLSELRTRAAWLTKEKNTAFSGLTTLDLLTRKLDDNTWLQRSELNRDRIVITGVAASPANLIGELEALPMLHDVTFETAITRDVTNDGSRFKLSAKLAPRSPGNGT